MSKTPLSESLQQGITAARSGHRLLARLHLARAIESEPNNEVALVWLASVAESPSAAVRTYQRVITMNPENEVALAGLTLARVMAEWDFTYTMSPQATLRAVADHEAVLPAAPEPPPQARIPVATPKPAVKTPASEKAAPAPVVEPKPVVVQAAPVVAEPKPVVVEAAPVVAEPKPAVVVAPPAPETPNPAPAAAPKPEEPPVAIAEEPAAKSDSAPSPAAAEVAPQVQAAASAAPAAEDDAELLADTVAPPLLAQSQQRRAPPAEFEHKVEQPVAAAPEPEPSAKEADHAHAGVNGVHGSAAPDAAAEPEAPPTSKTVKRRGVPTPSQAEPEAPAEAPMGKTARPNQTQAFTPPAPPPVTPKADPIAPPPAENPMSKSGRHGLARPAAEAAEPKQDPQFSPPPVENPMSKSGRHLAKPATQVAPPPPAKKAEPQFPAPTPPAASPQAPAAAAPTAANPMTESMQFPGIGERVGESFQGIALDGYGFTPRGNDRPESMPFPGARVIGSFPNAAPTPAPEELKGPETTAQSADRVEKMTRKRTDRITKEDLDSVRAGAAAPDTEEKDLFSAPLPPPMPEQPLFAPPRQKIETVRADALVNREPEQVRAPAPSSSNILDEPFDSTKAAFPQVRFPGALGETPAAPASLGKGLDSTPPGEGSTPSGDFIDLQDPFASGMGSQMQINPADSAVFSMANIAGPRRILVVDDSPTVCKIVSITLKKRGYEVMTAGDGVEAMSLIASVQPDLILLDITMPRMDGYQLCKLIKGYPSTKHIPVVMLSGKDGFFDRVRGKLVGCADYVTKPFDPEQLVQTIEKFLPAAVA